MGLRPAVLACAVAWALASSAARADWQVRRSSNAPLLDAAVSALWQRPDDVALARRAVQLAGRSGRDALLKRLQAHADERASYASFESYAHVLLLLDDPRGAAAAFGAALRAAPDSSAALAGRARALAAARDPGAAAAYDRALEVERRPAARRELLERALALLPPDPRGADLERAVALRRQVTRLAPRDARAAAALADLLEQAGRPEQAADALDQAAGRASLEVALRAARLRGASADPAVAARGAASLAALLKQTHDRQQRRRIWAAARDVARARGTLADLADELVARAPGLAEWDLLGEVRADLGDLEGALDATRRAHALDPRDAAVGRRLVALLDRTGRAPEARQVEEELVRRLPSDAQLARELADRQWLSGDHAAAEATFDRALIRFARQPEALQSLAELASGWHDNARAIRAWTVLGRLEPSDEVAVLGLGEAQFQAGDRHGARRTWATVRRRSASAADGHLRLGEILLDHDLAADAGDEARAAETLQPRSPAPHRLLARIAERVHQTATAVSEWEQVLALAAGTSTAESVAARHEARTRLLALIANEGHGQLAARIRTLRETVAAHPDDLESALFLAQAEQRAGDLEGAAATLRAVADRGGAAAASEASVEAGFALVRLLKHQGRLPEAEARLDELARVVPARAREADLQAAEIALARHDRAGALGRANAAAAGADPAALTRVGEIREQAGDDRGAADAYRTAQASPDAPPTAALALARVQARQGDARAAAATLEALLQGSRDDASVGDAARRAAGLDELLGRLPALAESLARADPDGASAPARRRALMDVLARLPPPASDPAAGAAWARLGRLALRPLLDILAADREAPDRRAIELLGRLGDGDAAPALARIAARALEKGAVRDPRHAGFVIRETAFAALSALARLGDPRGFDVLVRAAEDPSPSLRRIGLWGLGRIGDPRGAKVLARALDEPQVDLQVLACLGLGRVTDGRGVATLSRIAQDPSRARPVRRAALAALGRLGPLAVDPLLALFDGADAELAEEAGLAVAATHDPRVPAALIGRALLPGRRGTAGTPAVLPALAVWIDNGDPRGNPLSTPTDPSLGTPSTADLLADALPAPSGADPAPAWRGRVPEITRLLADALASPGEGRRGALHALDSRTDEPGLGELTPSGDEPIPPESAQAAREIAAGLADAMADLLDDPDRAIRAGAMSVLAKVGDRRVDARRIAAAVADGDADLAEAAVTSARLLTRGSPGGGAAVAAAVAPLARDEGRGPPWRTRLAAVRVLAELGPAGSEGLRAAAGDRNPLVRAAARAAEAQRHAPGAAPTGSA